MVDKIKQKAMKVALIFAAICLLIFLNWNREDFTQVIDGILFVLIIGVITFFISKSAIKNKLNFKWWQWIFYVIGWIVGFVNPLFWLIMVGIHQAHNYGDQFFSKAFHRRVYIWGIVATILIAIFVPLIFFIL